MFNRFKSIPLIASSVTVALASMPISAEIINVTGTAAIYSVIDSNNNVLAWSDEIYERGTLMSFSMRIDTDNIDNKHYYNDTTNEVIFDRDGGPDYPDWPTRVKGSNYGNDYRLSTYTESFSTMVVTLPEVVINDTVYPERTFSHKPINNPLAFKIGENFLKQANSGSKSTDRIDISHYDLVEYAQDNGPYIEHNHQLKISENSIDLFHSGNILEPFSYYGGTGTTFSSFSTKQKKVTGSAPEELTIRFQVKSLNWEPMQACY
tara:strand:+ start:16794 stop:17582 length:789 start_codon:yes stop_codon:yes gene_type:complete